MSAFAIGFIIAFVLLIWLQEPPRFRKIRETVAAFKRMKNDKKE